MGQNERTKASKEEFLAAVEKLGQTCILGQQIQAIGRATGHEAKMPRHLMDDMANAFAMIYVLAKDNWPDHNIPAKHAPISSGSSHGFPPFGLS